MTALEYQPSHDTVLQKVIFTKYNESKFEAVI